MCFMLFKKKITLSLSLLTNVTWWKINCLKTGLETNGETTSPLYIGVNPSSSPIMFSGAGNIPPPPPYFMGPPLPPFMPLPLPSGSTSFDVGQRPPPLGGRLSSPPPMPPLYSPPGRYNNHGTPPPPLSPSSADFIPPPIRGNHSSSAFAHDRNSPPHFQSPPWGDDTLAPSRNNSGFHSSHRDQRNRDRRGLYNPEQNNRI